LFFGQVSRRATSRASRNADMAVSDLLGVTRRHLDPAVEAPRRLRLRGGCRLRLCESRTCQRDSADDSPRSTSCPYRVD
jgi:hypothetical protein